MKKNVLFFIECLHCGGAEKSLISLLPLLDYDKMDVDLLLLKRGGVFEQYIPENVRIIDFKQHVHPWLFRFYQTLFSLRLRRNQVTGRKEHGAESRWKTMHRAYTPLKKHYDVAIAYQQGFPTYYIASKVDADKKIAWANVDLTKAGYCAAYNSRFYLGYDSIVAVSDNLKRMLIEEGFVREDKAIVVQDILNVNLIREMAKQPQHAIQTRKLKLVTVGRMVYQKGYDIAVETADILRRKGLDFCWYFVGDGVARKEVETLVSEKHLGDYVFLLGEQANPYPYMSAADIYVQTSRFEGFGLTLAEARILGKPAVSTDFPVVHNQITDGKNGLIAGMQPDSIADKIMLLAEDIKLREDIIAATKQETNTTAEVESAKINRMIVE